MVTKAEMIVFFSYAFNTEPYLTGGQKYTISNPKWKMFPKYGSNPLKKTLIEKSLPFGPQIITLKFMTDIWIFNVWSCRKKMFNMVIMDLLFMKCTLLTMFNKHQCQSYSKC